MNSSGVFSVSPLRLGACLLLPVNEKACPSHKSVVMSLKRQSFQDSGLVMVRSTANPRPPLTNEVMSAGLMMLRCSFITPLGLRLLFGLTLVILTLEKNI